MYPEIKSFLDESGRLTSMPSKRRKQLHAVVYVFSLMKLEEGREYSEKEINTLLDELITYHDTATLRRELVDLGFLFRTRDCSIYRLNAQAPTLEELLLKL